MLNRRSFVVALVDSPIAIQLSGKPTGRTHTYRSGLTTPHNIDARQWERGDKICFEEGKHLIADDDGTISVRWGASC